MTTEPEFVLEQLIEQNCNQGYHLSPTIVSQIYYIKGEMSN